MVCHWPYRHARIQNQCTETAMDEAAFECPFCTYDDLETAIKGAELPVLGIFLHKKISIQEQMLGVRGLCRCYCNNILILGITVDTYGIERVRFNICNYPTYILFNEGHEVGRAAGAVTKPEFEDLMRQAGVCAHAAGVA